jgi:hypothetical protein
MSTSEAAVVRLISEIQAETLELDNLRKHGASAPELEAKERVLERLRWRLAVIARRAAQGNPGGAG